MVLAAASTNWRRLQKLHKDYCRELDQELAGLNGDEQLQRYIAEARASVESIPHDSYKSLSKNEFFDQVIGETDVLYVGDFHPDPRPKELLLEITRQARQKGRRVVWVLESVPGYANASVDGGTSTISGEDLVRRYFEDGDQTIFFGGLDLEANLGADRVNYVNLFETARDENIPIVAAGVPRGEQTTTTVRRGPRIVQKTAKLRNIKTEDSDPEIAKVVSYTKRTDPDALVCVFYGDHHLSRPHLPEKVDIEVKRWTNKTLKSDIILSTDESVYNRVVIYGTRNDRNIISLGDSGTYVVVNTTPLERRLSTIIDDNHSEDGGGLEDRLLEMLNMFAEYLRMDSLGDIGEIVVGVDRKPQFLKKRLKVKSGKDEKSVERDLSPQESGLRQRRLDRSKATVLSDGTMYIEHVKVRDIAEILGIYLHNLYLAQRNGADVQMADDDFFWHNVLRNTMGYFTSKLINPTRRYRGMDDYRRVMESIGADVRSSLEEERRIYTDALDNDKPITVAVEARGTTTLRKLTKKELWVERKKLDEKLAMGNMELAGLGNKAGGYRHDNKVWRQAEIATRFVKTEQLPAIPDMPESIKGVPNDISLEDIIVDEDSIASKIPTDSALLKGKSREEVVEKAVLRAKERRKQEIEAQRGSWRHSETRAQNERDDLAEILGYQLGHKLFAGIMSGEIKVPLVRDKLFQNDHRAMGKARETYETLRGIAEPFGNESYDDYL